MLSRKKSPEWILEGDIKSCYDEISHDWMERNIPKVALRGAMDKLVLRKWLKAGVMENGTWQPTESGTPQGGIMAPRRATFSPVLANLTLNGLEQKIREKYPKNSQRNRQAQVNFVRFADDFIITGSTREILEQEVKPLVETFLAERGLKLSAEKTIITHIQEGFDFLGQTIRKHKGKYIAKPSKKNYQAFMGKVRTTIKKLKGANAATVIRTLNPIIQGKWPAAGPWANYHQHANSKETYAKADHEIFESVWKWAKQSHQNQGRTWIAQQYFRPPKGVKWTLNCIVVKPDGTKQNISLTKASATPIRRHTKIQGTANPYDPEWEHYFEDRLKRRMQHEPNVSYDELVMWNRQAGICPWPRSGPLMCQQPLIPETGWEVHHKVWRVHGGKDTMENRELLHPHCHRQLHSQASSRTNHEDQL